MSVMDPAIAAERYAHGTYARYRLGMCRCFQCKVALSNYVYKLSAEKRKIWRVHYVQESKGWCVRNRETKEIRLRTHDRKLAYRTVEALNKQVTVTCDREFVDTAKTLKHIRKLQAAGVGYKVIAKRAGIGCTAVMEIISGASKKTRRETQNAILSVDATVLAPGQKIDAHETWKLLDLLINFGFSKVELNRRINSRTKARCIQIARNVVTVRTAQSVRTVYDAVFAADENFRLYVDPIAEGLRKKKAERAYANAPRETPLSKRDPDVARRWNELFSEGSGL